MAKTLKRNSSPPRIGRIADARQGNSGDLGAVDRVAAVAEYAADRIRTNADMVAGNVRECPLVALLIVGVVGHILGRAAR